MRIKNVVFVKSKLATYIQLYSVLRIKTDAREFCCKPVTIHCSITVNALWSLWGLTRCCLFFWCCFFFHFISRHCMMTTEKTQFEQRGLQRLLYKFNDLQLQKQRGVIVLHWELNYSPSFRIWMNSHLLVPIDCQITLILHCTVFECVCVSVFVS